MPAFPTDVAGKVAVAHQLKNDGNTFFKEGRFKKSSVTYAKALAFTRGLPGRHSGLEGFGKMAAESNASKNGNQALSAEMNVEITELEINLNNNLSLCHAKLENATEALKCAEAALALNPSGFKAKIRKAEAVQLTRNYEKATKLFDDALQSASCETERVLALKAKNKVIELDKKATHKQDKKMRGFFDRAAALDEKEEKESATFATTTAEIPVVAKPSVVTVDEPMISSNKAAASSSSGSTVGK
jgi:tetratricopeptide (TPR) repeat protein